MYWGILKQKLRVGNKGIGIRERRGVEKGKEPEEKKNAPKKAKAKKGYRERLRDQKGRQKE